MTVQEIGAVRGEFKPAFEERVAGFIIGLLIIGAWCAELCFVATAVIQSGGRLPLWAEKGWSWGAIAISGALAIGLIVGGVFFVRWLSSPFSLRVRVASGGLSVTRKDETQVIAWSDIDSVEEIHLYKPMVSRGLAKYVLPKVMSESFTLNMTGREPFTFGANTIRGHTFLAQMIKRRRINETFLGTLWKRMNDKGCRTHPGNVTSEWKAVAQGVDVVDAHAGAHARRYRGEVLSDAVLTTPVLFLPF
jgi:hypothetical protein